MTKEEINEYVKQFIPRMVKVRNAIVDDIKARGTLKKGVSGQITCPECGTGTVDYTYAGNYNRHIHARCSTEGCVAWME